MIEKILEKLGFGEKEIIIYLEIARRGKVTPATLARITGINRATVYSVAKELLEKGVITEDRAHISLYYVALSPEGLRALIEKQEQKTKKTRRLVYDAIDVLAQIPLNTQYSVPKIRFIEEENVLDHLYRQSPVWNKSILATDPSKKWWGFQDHTFVENYKEWIVWYWNTSSKEITSCFLSNQSNVEKEMSEKNITRRGIIFWKQSENFTATTWVIGEYIVMIYTRERPFYLIEIHNPVLAHNMREVFKGIWKDMEKSKITIQP